MRTLAVQPSSKDKRHYYRHPIRVPLQVEEISSEINKIQKAQCEDLSEKGLSFFWNHALSEGSLIHLMIPIEKQVFKVEGRVAYSRKIKMGLFRIGVAFQNARSAFEAKLAEEILKIKEYRKNISINLGTEISEEDAAKKWIEKFAVHFSHLF